VQFDDLFKIAWEEDAANKLLQEGVVQQSAESEGINGTLYYSHTSYVQVT
jgi:antiviral helicase SKI2